MEDRERLERRRVEFDLLARSALDDFRHAAGDIGDLRQFLQFVEKGERAAGGFALDQREVPFGDLLGPVGSEDRGHARGRAKEVDGDGELRSFWVLEEERGRVGLDGAVGDSGYFKMGIDLGVDAT